MMSKDGMRCAAAKFLLISALSVPIGLYPAKGNFTAYLNGPSFSKHLSKYDKYFNNFHWGIGLEADYELGKKWLLGGQLHYMFNDSSNENSYWGGATLGKMLWGKGNRRGFWAVPTLIVGGIKKAEYNNGSFGLFCLPFVSFGYGAVAINAVFIPKIRSLGIDFNIILVQIKVQLFKGSLKHGKSQT